MKTSDETAMYRVYQAVALAPEPMNVGGVYDLLRAANNGPPVIASSIGAYVSQLYNIGALTRAGKGRDALYAMPEAGTLHSSEALTKQISARRAVQREALTAKRKAEAAKQAAKEERAAARQAKKADAARACPPAELNGGLDVSVTLSTGKVISLTLREIDELHRKLNEAYA